MNPSFLGLQLNCDWTNYFLTDFKKEPPPFIDTTVFFFMFFNSGFLTGWTEIDYYFLIWKLGFPCGPISIWHGP